MIHQHTAHAKAVTVGGGHHQPLTLERDLNAGEGGAAFVGGGGKDNLIDHFAQAGCFQGDGAAFQHFGCLFGAIAVVHRGHNGELGGVDAFDVGVDAATTQVQRLCTHRKLHVNALGRQAVDKFSQQTSRHGDRTFVFDAGANPAVDADLQVGGRQAQLVVFGFN